MMGEMQKETKQIAYWCDGYFISDDDAIEQAELLDSVDAFGGEHGLLEVSIDVTEEEIQQIVHQELSAAA
jgi:hypothetical protein